MKRTKADLEARCDRLDRENTLLSYALSAAMNGTKPVAIERWRGTDKGEKYSASLYAPTAPHGGFIIATFSYPGQSDAHSVHYADAWTSESYRDGVSLGNLPLATAAERLGNAARAARLERAS